MTAYAVHFPSQGGPTELRRQALSRLMELTAKLPKERLVVAGGDFNITEEEEIQNKLIEKNINPNFLISHQIGCQSCEGTHAYRGHWSFLDMLIFSKNMGSKGVAAW